MRPLILKVTWFSCLLVLVLGSKPAWAISSRIDSLLHALDQTLAHQANYDKQRLNRLAALKAELRSGRADANAGFDLTLLICREYEVFKYDSAFAYSRRLNMLARRLHDPVKLQTARTRLAFVLRSAGLFKDAFDTLRVIRVHQLAPGYRAEFYEIYSIVCIELAEYDQDGYYQPFYTAKAYAYADTAARYYQLGSYANLAQLLFQAKQQNNLAAGIKLYGQLRHLRLTPHQLAINASALAKLYENANQPERALELMTLAAIGDIQSATKEGIALFNVSAYCYQRGDLQRAYRYITDARQTAIFYRARQRLVQISPILSLIDGQKITLVERQRQQARTYAAAIGLLAALVLASALTILVQLRRGQRTSRLLAASNQELHANNDKLQQLNHRQQQLNTQLQELNRGLNEANRIKEEYIGYYFSNASRYVNKLEALQKKLSTLLTTKQLTAAQRMVEDINIKSERLDLFRGFDAVFISLFPNFINDFNALFTEEEQIHLADDQLLTTELRIFALIRLGIHDSEQISRILGYSIHTVYAYKTRVKNRSFVPNENFEARVLAIQSRQPSLVEQ